MVNNDYLLQIVNTRKQAKKMDSSLIGGLTFLGLLIVWVIAMLVQGRIEE